MTISDTSGTLQMLRGVPDMAAARTWLAERQIEDLECMTCDQAGVARGKLMPAEKFFNTPDMNIPSSVLTQTITGDYALDSETFKHDPVDSDLVLKPDLSTLTVVPWASDPTGQIIHDAYYKNGDPVDISPRNVLKQVLAAYDDMGLKPIIAPELEFYLVKPNTDPDYPLEPPVGRSGRSESGRQLYSISAVNEFDDLFDDIYDYSEAQGLEIDTLVHEEGAGQMEINLRHGDPLTLADQVFLFKRTIREAALRHNMYATFMAKPIAGEPASSMHIHQSVVSLETGDNAFSGSGGEPTDLFYNFIAGQNAFLPNVMCILAPYVNSYRRLARKTEVAINVNWDYDNRTVGLRVPLAGAQARRVENRIPCSDANPYLSIAASLACGLIGIRKKLDPPPPLSGSGEGLPYGVPRGLLEAVDRFEKCPELIDLLGARFVATFCAIKLEEYETFMAVISPWEREYLLLNV